MMNALTRLAASSMWPCMTQTVTCVWSRGCGQPGEVCSGAHGKQWAPTRWYTVGFRASVTLLLYTSACSSSANVFETFDGSLCSLCTTIQWGICSVWLVYVQYIGTYCSFEHYYSSDGTVSGWVGDAGWDCSKFVATGKIIDPAVYSGEKWLMTLTLLGWQKPTEVIVLV